MDFFISKSHCYGVSLALLHVTFTIITTGTSVVMVTNHAITITINLEITFPKQINGVILSRVHKDKQCVKQKTGREI